MPVIDSTLWRFVVGAPEWNATATTVDAIPIITFLDRLVSDRQVDARLNEPLSISGSVPADSPEVTIEHDDGDPFLAEGNRVIWGFRREDSVDSLWVPRAAGIILNLNDEATNDGMRTNFVAYDPWQYLYSRPALLRGSDYPPTDTASSSVFPGDNGINYGQWKRGSTIVCELLEDTINCFGDCFIDAGTAYGGTASWDGVIEDTAYLEWFNIQQGTTVGQAWADLVATGTLDIVLKPIYDPVNRPGYLCELSVYARAGTIRPEAVMAWDLPSRTALGLTRENDGTGRGNILRYHNGQGGPPAETIPDLPSTTTASMQKYGRWLSEQFFPYQIKGAAISELALSQYAMTLDGKQSVSVRPVPTMAPEPFRDYELGDTVPVYASANLRTTLAGYYRVVGMPIEIDDNAVERVQELVVLPESEFYTFGTGS